MDPVQLRAQLAQKHPDWWWVKILSDDFAWVEKNAKARNRYANSRGMKSRTKDLDDKWHIAGLAGELAVSLVYHLPMGEIVRRHKSEMNSGDLSDWVEVKTRTEADPRRMDIAVNEDHLRDERAYVLAQACLWPNWIAVSGWAWGSLFRQSGMKMRNPVGQPMYVIPHGALNPVRSLFDEIRKR